MATDIFELLQDGDLAKLVDFVSADPESVRVRRTDGMTPLMLAAYLQRSDLIDVILEADPPVDFFEAAAIGEDSIVRDFLLEDGDIVNEKNFDGFTALHLSAFFGHELVADVLLGAGADPNVVNDEQSKLRPIHSAVAAQEFEIVEHLLDHGADPNVAQQGGITPLMGAASHGDLSMVWLLAERGADVNASSDEGATALTFAEKGEHDDVASWLQKSKSADSSQDD